MKNLMVMKAKPGDIVCHDSKMLHMAGARATQAMFRLTASGVFFWGARTPTCFGGVVRCTRGGILVYIVLFLLTCFLHADVIAHLVDQQYNKQAAPCCWVYLLRTLCRTRRCKGRSIPKDNQRRVVEERVTLEQI